MSYNISTFVRASREIFSFLKNTKNIKESFIKAISTDNLNYLIVPFGYYLIKEGGGGGQFINKILKWRIENKKFYDQKMSPTFASTRNWLENEILKNPDRIMFLIYDEYGQLMGHQGIINKEFLKNSIELDNLVLDNSVVLVDQVKIIKNIINWSIKTINVEKIYLRIFSNHKAKIDLYKKAGFYEIKLLSKKNNININKSTYAYFDTIRPKIKLLCHKNNKLEKNKKIFTAGPSISQKEVFYVNDAVQNGWNENHSRYLDLFQKKFSEIIGVNYCIATSSCTGAMVIALMALGIGRGDEVIVPDISWVASGRAIQMVGATPIFVDVKENDWTIDCSKIVDAINKKTKAILPVHLYGMPCDMSEIIKIAKKYNLKIIEDAAPAIGATHKNVFCGSFGDFGTFSFQGAKLTVTGEGGMLVTKDLELYRKALKIWDFGRNIEKTFWIDKIGVKYKMSNIQAALGLGQIERLDEMIYMKRRIFKWYKKHLNEEKAKIVEESLENFSTYWMSSISLLKKKITRDQLIVELRNRSIDSRPVFPNVSKYPIWTSKYNNVNSTKIAKNGLNLPSAVGLSENDIKRVCKEINSLI